MSNNELLNLRFTNFIMKYKNLLDQQIRGTETSVDTSLHAFVDSALILAKTGLEEMENISDNAATTPKGGPVVTGVIEQ